MNYFSNFIYSFLVIFLLLGVIFQHQTTLAATVTSTTTQAVNITIEDELLFTTTQLYVNPPCRAPIIIHGVVVHRGVEMPGEKLIPSGAVVMLTCEDGYVIKGENRSACLEYGWDPEIGYCSPLSDDFSECGFQSRLFTPPRSTSIEATPGEFPWMAKMEVEFQDLHGTSVCGATLIARGWMLTAAHCLKRAPINGIALTIDQTKFNVFIEPNERRRNVTGNAISIIYHPLYKDNQDGTYSYDFALIKLQPVARLGDRVRTICLPDLPGGDMCKTSADLTRGLNRDNCKDFYSAGWGTTEVDVPLTFSNLRKVPSSLIKPDTCKNRLNISDSVNFCAVTNRNNVCFASPGIPLMCAKSNRFFMVGVYSHKSTRHCAGEDDSDPDLYVYGRICEIIYWLRLTMGDVLPTTTTPRRPTPASRRTTKRPQSPSYPPKTAPLRLEVVLQNPDCPKNLEVKFAPELGEAAAGGNLAWVRQLLDGGADPNGIGYPSGYYPEPCGWNWHWPNASALIWAAGCNRTSEILTALIENGANINYRDFYGMNALIAASLHGNEGNVRILLDAGADISLKNNAGDSALIVASFFGFLDTVRILINRGADVNAKTAIGSTALMEASANNRLETVRLLLENGADANAKTMDGVTALMRASGEGFTEVVQLLIDYGAYLDAKEEINGWSAVVFASENERDETLALLLRRGARRDGCRHVLCRTCQGRCDGYSNNGN